MHRLSLFIFVSLIQRHYAFIQPKPKISTSYHHRAVKHRISRHHTRHRHHHRDRHYPKYDEVLTRKEVLNHFVHTSSLSILTNEIFINHPANGIGLPKKDRPQIEFCLLAVLRVSDYR